MGSAKWAYIATIETVAQRLCSNNDMDVREDSPQSRNSGLERRALDRCSSAVSHPPILESSAGLNQLSREATAEIVTGEMRGAAEEQGVCVLGLKLACAVVHSAGGVTC